MNSSNHQEKKKKTWTKESRSTLEDFRTRPEYVSDVIP
jgi:hypothetical protein